MDDSGKIEKGNSSNAEHSSMNETPDGVFRMKTLRAVMEKTLNAYCANLRLTRSLSKVNHNVQKQWEKETLSQLKNNIKIELENIYSDEGIEELLDNLDKITAESAVNTPDQQAWRPTGNPRLDSAAHLAVLKEKKLRVLNDKLTELQAHNGLLQTRVHKHNMELERSAASINALVAAFDKVIVDKSEYMHRTIH